MPSPTYHTCTHPMSLRPTAGAGTREGLCAQTHDCRSPLCEATDLLEASHGLMNASVDDEGRQGEGGDELEDGVVDDAARHGLGHVLRQVHLLVCVVADVADHCAQESGAELRSSDSGGTEDVRLLRAGEGARRIRRRYRRWP